MARPREFDADRALHDALEVFWRKGYEATSMQDLVAAMGIQKASLYAAFGDKRSLYVAALRRYQQETLGELTEHLAKAPLPLAAIREFVKEVADHAAGRDGRHGCFCINANIELAPSDDAIGDDLRRHHDRMVAVLAATLERAKAAGELAEKVDSEGLATFVLALVVAINVLGKQRASRRQIRTIVDHGLAALHP